MCSLLFILLLTTSGLAGDLASSFEQAVALADTEGRPAAEAYSKNDLSPYYKQKYFPVFQSCLAPTKHPDTTPFSFVAALGADGRVMRLYVDHETSVFACVRQTLQTDEFPHPPVSPYYWHVSMNFGQQQAQVQISSTPEGADLEIDGNYFGSTPSTVSLTSGEHHISVTKTSFKPWERKITVSTGQVSVNAALEAEQQ
jgi:hypothetical protein